MLEVVPESHQNFLMLLLTLLLPIVNSFKNWINLSGVKPIVSNAFGHQFQPKTIIASRRECSIPHHASSSHYSYLGYPNKIEVVHMGRHIPVYNL